MGRKKKRNKSVASEKSPQTQTKKTPKVAASAAPKALEKKPSQLGTYILCGVMFAAGVLAEKTIDRWKERQDLALKRTKQTESRASSETRSKF